jgi:DNA-3-methyladenine glycosylase I
MEPATEGPERCEWAGSDPAMVRYHDEDWGVPAHEDPKLFEFLTLEGAQAGLSWSTILGRRRAYGRAFAAWDISRIARFGPGDVARLVADQGIVRHRGKIESTISNARVALEVIDEEGSLDRFLWDFVGGRPKQNRFREAADIPAETERSGAMSVELKRRGFRFVGATTCYAFMQAIGMVNDHVVGCFRHPELRGRAGTGGR